jgi:hypothetical protein
MDFHINAVYFIVRYLRENNNLDFSMILDSLVIHVAYADFPKSYSALRLKLRSPEGIKAVREFLESDRSWFEYN